MQYHTSKVGRLLSGGALSVLGLISMGGCFMDSGQARSNASGGLSGELTLTGSSTVAPLILEIAKQFEAEHPGIRINVQTGGSSRGIADAQRGTADIGMASRSLSEDEREHLVAHAIARDGVGVIVHGENPVSELTKVVIRAIFTGRTSTWELVGGNDAPITVVNKAAGRATLKVFVEHFGIQPKTIQADVIIGDNEQGIKTVAADPHAIGYVSIGTAEYHAENGVPIKLLAVDGVEATTANVAAGSFPVARPLNLVTRGAPSGLAQTVIDYCQSSAVHDLVRDLYFVPVGSNHGSGKLPGGS